MEGTPKFCNICGQPMGNTDNGPGTMQQAPMQYQKAKTGNKTILIGIAVVAIAVLVLILIFSGGGSDEKDYTKLIDNYFSAVEKSDEKAILSMIPDDFLEYYKENMGTDMPLDVFDGLYSYYGNKITSWKITSATEITGDDLVTGLNTLEIKESRVKGAYDLIVEVVFGGPDYTSTETVNISVLKIDGNWSLVSVY
jgi:hypothetical protein